MLPLLTTAQHCAENNLEVADFCGGLSKNFSATDELYVKRGSSLTLMCRVQSSVVYWAYLDTIDALVLNNYPISTKDGAITFLFTEQTGGCLVTNATITNISSVIDTPIVCYTNEGNYSSVMLKHSVGPSDVSLSALRVCDRVNLTWTEPDDPLNQTCDIVQYLVTISSITDGHTIVNSTKDTNFLTSKLTLGSLYQFSVTAETADAQSGIQAIVEINFASPEIIISKVSLTVDNAGLSDALATLTWIETGYDTGISTVSYSVMPSNESSQVTLTSNGDTNELGAVTVSSLNAPVIFIVSAQIDKNYTCFSTTITLPALLANSKVLSVSASHIEVRLDFLYMVVVTEDLVVSPYGKGSCMAWCSGEKVLIDCISLTEGLEYNISVDVMINMNGSSLSVTVNSVFTPTAPEEPSSIQSFVVPMATLAGMGCNQDSETPIIDNTSSGCEVALGIIIASVSVVITAALSTLITTMVSYLCLKRKLLRHPVYPPKVNSPIYETPYTDVIKKGEKEQVSLCLSVNTAYGQVQLQNSPTWANPSTGVYDSVVE